LLWQFKVLVASTCGDDLTTDRKQSMGRQLMSTSILYIYIYIYISCNIITSWLCLTQQNNTVKYSSYFSLQARGREGGKGHGPENCMKHGLSPPSKTADGSYSWMGNMFSNCDVSHVPLPSNCRIKLVFVFTVESCF